MTADPSEAAQLDLRFALRGGRTVLDRRLFSWPFTLTRTFHLESRPVGMLSVILQTSSGALHAGDRLLQNFHACAGSAAHVTTQGATAVHRAPPGTLAREAVLLRAEDGAHLEVLPEPKILFPDAALAQNIEIVCAAGATVLVSDAFIGHDPDGGERGFRHLEARTIVRRPQGEPLLIDRLRLDGPPAAHGARAGYRAFGNLHILMPADSEARDKLCRSLTAAAADIEGLYAAASPLPNDLGIGFRLAATGGVALRQGLGSAWAAARDCLTGARPTQRSL